MPRSGKPLAYDGIGNVMTIAHISQGLLKALKWLAHPIVVFVGLQIVWLAITVMWVLWFVDSVEEITKLTQSLGSQYLDSQYALAMLISGCVLLGVLLVGTVVLFVFGQRQTYLIGQQKSFVSSVTHELRSPLASLQLTFETLKTRQLEAANKEKLLDMASQDIERLTRLVNQILVSSRLDKGIIGLTEEAQTLQVHELIRKTCSRCHWLDPEVEQRVEVVCEESLEIDAPLAVVSLILSNLMENAIKYSPTASPIKVLVTASPRLITIAVKDQGFGLTKREKERIFRMFHRAAITHKKAIPGTGLGLYMVRSLARVLGGQAWAESQGPGTGSTFFVTLPLASKGG